MNHPSIELHVKTVSLNETIRKIWKMQIQLPGQLVRN